jgi:ubiquinone/menaquinone biosynthesis C-methylase UbiE
MSEAPTASPAPSPLATPGPWDLVAAGYEEETRPYMTRFSALALELLGLEPQHLVLDVACGPGTTTLLAAPRVTRVEGLDFAASMLEQAQKNLEAAGITNVTLTQGDGQNLPFTNDTFDRAFSMFGLMFFPDRPRGFRELFRVLRSGGRALVSSWAPMSESPLMTALFTPVRAFDPSRPTPQADISSLENPRVLESEMVAAGFSDVKVETFAHELEFATARDLWNAMIKGSVPLVLLRRSLGEAVWQEKEPRAIAALEEVVGGRTSLSSRAHLGFGTKR